MYMQNLTTYLLTSLSIFLFNRYRYNLNLKSFPTRRSSDLIYKEMYEEIKKDIDKIVDHILSINGIPYATMIKFIKEATIEEATDRKSTRLNSSHVAISYAVFCLKKKKK